jgi:hypothetical protein
MIRIAEILQGIAVGANSSFIERVVSVGVGAGVALSVTKMWKVQPPAKADQVDRPTAITTSPPWALDVKHARLILLGILVMCGVFVRHELWELRRQTLPVGSITAFAGDATKLATLAEQGWAVCDGRSSEEQGITHAKVPRTPDLSARYLEGATANDFKQLKPAHFPVLQFNNFGRGGPGTYDHGEFNVATDGTSMTKNGLHMFVGKWDTPASVIDVKWKTTNGAIDVAPASYTVVYIMLVK